MTGTDRESPWAPFVPASHDPWDLRKVAHLHRRAGFGATWQELQRDLRDGPAASVARLFASPAHSASEREVLDSLEHNRLLLRRGQSLSRYRR